MNNLKKLEVACGALTALLGIAAAAQMLHTDMETMRRLERSFPFFQELLGSGVLYALPGLLVGLGSYLHASKALAWAFWLTVISCLYLIAIFVLFFSVPVYHTANLTFWIDLSLALFAVVTMIVSAGGRVLDAK